MENKSKVECEHRWTVVLSVKFLPWEDFIGTREEGSEKEALEQDLTHTLFCTKCQSIKQVD